MIKANIADRCLIAGILADAFESNQSVNYIIPPDKKRLKRIRALMEYSFDVCYYFGQVWLSEDKKACALILFPQLKRFALVSVWLDIKLIFKTIGLSRLRSALRREALIKQVQSKDHMVYLWFIGVSPEYQHTGIGSKLLNEIINEANSKTLPVCLETSTLQNLPWYEHFGFKVYNQLDLGYTLFFLKREPNN